MVVLIKGENIFCLVALQISSQLGTNHLKLRPPTPARFTESAKIRTSLHNLTLGLPSSRSMVKASILELLEAFVIAHRKAARLKWRTLYE